MNDDADVPMPRDADDTFEIIVSAALHVYDSNPAPGTIAATVHDNACAWLNNVFAPPPLPPPPQ